MPPATTGSLADKPLAHLFVYSLEKKLTGTLELAQGPGTETATIVLSGGEVARIRTSARVAYLGGVLYELGFIQDAELNASLLELAKQKRPHGQILLDRGSITKEKLAEGLREQALRKLAHLFSFGSKSTFGFHPNADLLGSYGGTEAVITNPSPAIWRGIREHPSEEHVRQAVERIGTAPCRLVRDARIERFQFHAEVLATTERLRGRAITLNDLHALSLMAPKATELLIYCLLITKEIEVVDVAAAVQRAPLPQLDAMRASVSKMAAVTPTSPEFTPQRPGAAGPQPISFTLKAAAPVAQHTSSSPSNSSLTLDQAAREKAFHDRAKGIQKEDYFQRLSLGKDASPQAIEDAFRALSRVWNPSDLPPALEGARESCALVRSMLVEAHETLRDPRKLRDYLHKLSLGPQLPDAASDLAASGERNDYDGAKACLARDDLDRAERMAKRAHKAEPNRAEALALLAWVAAKQPVNQGAEATRARIMMLDKALKLDPECEDALWFRAELHRRVENHAAAMKDLQKLTKINPDNVDAMRELRIYEMRVRRNSLSMQAVRSLSPVEGIKTISSGLLDKLRKK